MATALLTQELVNATANRLLAEHGKYPSTRAVFSELGFGSMTTLTRNLRKWRDDTPDLGANPSPLPEKLLRALEQLQRDTEKTVREDFTTDLANARDSEQLLIQENDQLLTQVAELQVQLQAAREDSTAAHGQVAQLQADNAVFKRELESERASLGELRIELAKTSLRLDESLPQLKQELGECRVLLDVARKAQADAELKAAVGVERAVGLEQRMADLQDRQNKAAGSLA